MLILDKRITSRFPCLSILTHDNLKEKQKNIEIHHIQDIGVFSHHRECYDNKKKYFPYIFRHIVTTSDRYLTLNIKKMKQYYFDT